VPDNSVRVVQLLPFGVIKAIFPNEGANKLAQDLDTFALPSRQRPLDIAASRNLTVTGPVDLVQGYTGILIQAPIFIAGVGPGELFGQSKGATNCSICAFNSTYQDKFWGFVQAVTDFRFILHNLAPLEQPSGLVGLLLSSSSSQGWGLFKIELTLLVRNSSTVTTLPGTLSAGYEYTLMRLGSGITNTSSPATFSGALTVAQVPFGKPPREPVSAFITSATDNWMLQVGLPNGWTNKGRQAGLLVMVVVLSLLLSVMLASLLLGSSDSAEEDPDAAEEDPDADEATHLMKPFRKHLTNWILELAASFSLALRALPRGDTGPTHPTVYNYKELLLTILPERLFDQVTRTRSFLDKSNHWTGHYLTARAPANIILDMMSDFLEGKQPSVKDIMVVKTTIMQARNIYAPHDFVKELKRCNMDDDVAEAIGNIVGHTPNACDNAEVFDAEDPHQTSMHKSLSLSCGNSADAASVSTLYGALGLLMAEAPITRSTRGTPATSLLTSSRPVSLLNVASVSSSCSAALDTLVSPLTPASPIPGPNITNTSTVPVPNNPILPGRQGASQLCPLANRSRIQPTTWNTVSHAVRPIGIPATEPAAGAHITLHSSATSTTPVNLGDVGRQQPASMLQQAEMVVGSHPSSADQELGRAAGEQKSPVPAGREVEGRLGKARPFALDISVLPSSLESMAGASSVPTLQSPAGASPTSRCRGTSQDCSHRQALSNGRSAPYPGSPAMVALVAFPGKHSSTTPPELQPSLRSPAALTGRTAVEESSRNTYHASQVHPYRQAAILRSSTSPGAAADAVLVAKDGPQPVWEGSQQDAAGAGAASLTPVSSQLYARQWVLLCPVMDQVEQLLGQARTAWSFDMWQLHEASRGHALSTLVFYLLNTTGLLDSLALDRLKLCRFLRAIEEAYLPQPYHNKIHAADVVQAFFVILTRSGMLPLYADPLTQLACLLAAAVHDLEHQGLTNDYLIASEHPLAQLYNDRSPMENHHLTRMFALLRVPEYAFLTSSMKRTDRALLRKIIIDQVLATDMRSHFSLTTQFSTLHRLGSPPPLASLLGCANSSSTLPAAGGAWEAAAGSTGSCRDSGARRGSEGSSCGRSQEFSGQSRKVGLETEAGAAPVTAVAPLDETERMLSLQIALKLADLSNLAKERDVYLKWVACLEEEAFLQGDKEKAAGLPVSPLYDRDKPGITKSQTKAVLGHVLTIGDLRRIRPLYLCLRIMCSHRQ
ncbi:hypothetical protein QJQ45_021878, partial [Haematococcus lacustris]